MEAAVRRAFADPRRPRCGGRGRRAHETRSGRRGNPRDRDRRGAGAHRGNRARRSSRDPGLRRNRRGGGRAGRGARHPPRGRARAGAAEVDAKIRLLDEPFARVRTAQPLVLDVFDRFVVRESGRQRTVGGGTVLDVGPPRAADPRHRSFLARRAAAARGDLPALLIEERGAVRADDVVLLTGGEPPTPHDGWCVAPTVRHAVRDAVHDLLGAFHHLEPLEEGAPLGVVRQAAGDAARRAGAPRAGGLSDTLLDLLASEGSIVRTSTTVRLATHRVALEARADDVRTLLERLSGEHEALPAPRACRPAAPRIAATSSLAPLATFGWSTKPGAEATNTVTWRIRSTRSNEPPSASRKADRACRAARRAASTPSSMLTWFPSDP